jgi:endonuclease/exonuclease/phosphatase family metal-dependent hydrolase
MHWHFHPAYSAKEEHYGDALLSRFPMRLVRAAALPTLDHVADLERRGALWVAVDWDGRTVQFLTTHLGLLGSERLVQVNELLGSNWLADPQCAPPIALCGDLNALPGTLPYRRLRSVLDDPFPWHGFPPGTFPTGCPVLRIDHVLLSNDWVVHSIAIPRTRLTRVASDHLPLVVEASLRQ